VGWSTIDLSRTPHPVRLQNGQPDKQRKTQVAAAAQLVLAREVRLRLLCELRLVGYWCWCFRRGEARLMCIFVIICPLNMTERK
jgi:hypothetical protein